MAKVIVRVNVAYPSRFLQTLASQAPVRQSKGERGCSTGGDALHQNIVYALLDWESVSSAKQFWESAEAKSHMSEWHSVEAPNLTFLRESSND